MDIRQYFESLTTSKVHQFVSEQQEENLHFEFKQVASNSLSRDDRKNFAKVLSGFANSAGGIVVWGVEARRNADGVDCAVGTKPIQGVSLLISRLNELTGQAVSPLVDGVIHIPLPEQNDFGYAASFIPQSESGPHMAKLGEDRYFKRSGDGFYRMEHYDIADMFGRRPHPQLDLVGAIDKKGHSGASRTPVVSLLLTIQNTGRGSAVAPFLRVDPPDGVLPDKWGVDGNGNNGLPQYPNPVFGFSRSYGSNSTFVLHPGAHIDVTRFNVIDSYNGDLHLPYSLAAEGVALVEGTLVVSNEEIKRFAR